MEYVTLLDLTMLLPVIEVIDGGEIATVIGCGLCDIVVVVDGTEIVVDVEVVVGAVDVVVVLVDVVVVLPVPTTVI